MGNSYSGAKPALPTLNINKVNSMWLDCDVFGSTFAAPMRPASRLPATGQNSSGCQPAPQQQALMLCLDAWSAWWLQAKQLNQDTPDDLFVGSGHPSRNVVPLSARLPGSARKLPATTAQQQQQLLSSKLQESSGSGIDLPSTLRLVANNIVAKPQVPPLNMGRHGEGSFHGSDQAATARGPGSLPHVPQQSRAANTSRPAFAATSQQQYAGTTERPASTAVETGPITPAQALKRYGEYLTAFEQSEVLQYSQVCLLSSVQLSTPAHRPNYRLCHGPCLLVYWHA